MLNRIVKSIVMMYLLFHTVFVFSEEELSGAVNIVVTQNGVSVQELGVQVISLANPIFNFTTTTDIHGAAISLGVPVGIFEVAVFGSGNKVKGRSYGEITQNNQVVDININL